MSACGAFSYPAAVVRISFLSSPELIVRPWHGCGPGECCQKHERLRGMATGEPDSPAGAGWAGDRTAIGPGIRSVPPGQRHLAGCSGQVRAVWMVGSLTATMPGRTLRDVLPHTALASAGSGIPPCARFTNALRRCCRASGWPAGHPALPACAASLAGNPRPGPLASRFPAGCAGSGPVPAGGGGERQRYRQ